MRYVAFDFETTGLFAATDRIVEIGAVMFEPDGAEIGRFESLVCPDRPVSPGALRVHGLGEAELAGAPRIAEVLPAFLAWIGPVGGVVLLAHHARFDAGFLGAEIARLGLPNPLYPIIDTLALARYRLPGVSNHKLDTLAALLGLEADGPFHRAIADSLRVRALWLRLDGASGPKMEYAPFDPAGEAPAPAGWERMVEAIARGRAVSMRYSGGTRGSAPRSITPRRIYYQGGAAYLAAFCHAAGFEKVFRLDRIESYELRADAQAEPLPATKPARRRRSG